MSEKQLMTILDDQPWGLGRSARRYPTDDPLGFRQLARRIGRVILRAEPNLTVGIYGDWGAGKTSFMRMMEELLAAEDNVMTVWFDAWEHHNTASPLLGLATSIKEQLSIQGREASGSSAGFWQRAGEIMSNLRSVSLLGFGISWEWDKREELADATAEYSKALRDLTKLGRDLGPGEPASLPRIVVFIDDLDRCSPEVSVRLLESIKLVFGEPGFVFVLGVMPEVIAAQVSRSPALQGCDGASGEEYLDKIMQLTFRLPTPSVTTTSSLVDYLCNEMGDPELAEHIRTFASVLTQIGGTVGTPRSIKRFINEFALERLAQEEQSAPLPGQNEMGITAAGPLEVACLQTLRYGWPSLHGNLLSRPSTVLVQLREAAGVSGDPVLLARRLAEIAQGVDDEAEAKRIKEGLALRAFLALQSVGGLLRDSDRLLRVIQGPLAPVESAESQTPGLPSSPIGDGPADLVRRFEELALQFQIEPSQTSAQRILSLVESGLDRLSRTSLGNTAVQLASDGYAPIARRIFEAMDAGGMLADWLHASQFVVLLLTDEKDIAAAESIMSRFAAEVPFEDPVQQQRWDLCQGLLGKETDLGKFLERLKESPDDKSAMFGLGAALVGTQSIDEGSRRIALDALVLFCGSDVPPLDKLQMTRGVADSLAKGSGDTAFAAAALFWALKGSEMWDDFGTKHNLANVTFADLEDSDLAVALWTVAYSEGGRADSQVRIPFSKVLSQTDAELALKVLQGEELLDMDQRLAVAIEKVEAAAWSREKIVETLMQAGSDGPWGPLFEAGEEAKGLTG